MDDLEEEIRGRKAQILIRELLALSVSQVWAVAKFEWEPAFVYFNEETNSDGTKHRPGTCLCTHTPIIEHCVIKNRFNGKEATVGNCCVKKFLGVDESKVFSCLKRIKKNINAAPNAEMIAYLIRKKRLEPEEATFLSLTMKNHRLDSWKRRGINHDILRYFDYCADREARKEKPLTV
ncbi:hypothetical protein V4C53_30170 [Paraburkholderia azotifigens]|uniref:hypothetical protein n=1 Tax=Paraburkholderia azotifigens TaxID=2057004 RepID=UPI00316E3B06